MSNLKVSKVSETKKFTNNPFLNNNGNFVKLDRGKKTIIAGSTKKIIVDSETGEMEGVTIMHKYKEVDRSAFIKFFVEEISALFGLTKTGLKTFGYILTCLRINNDSIYIHIPKLMIYAKWGSSVMAYRGLGELIANKIIAPSVEPNIWFINPNIVFNGDRIAFVKELLIKKEVPLPKQLEAFPEDENNMSSATLHE